MITNEITCLAKDREGHNGLAATIAARTISLDDPEDIELVFCLLPSSKSPAISQHQKGTGARCLP